MIELQNVTKFYSNNGITNIGLKNISLKFNKGEIVAITGESGSGKSTLLNVISKIDFFDDGEIYYKGNETSYFSVDDMDQFRKNKVGFIFQNYNIIDSYTVLQNVMLPLIINGYSKKEAKKSALELIEKVGLSHRKNNRGTKLSGGEKQRCVIARALASKCEILACDEPTGNLDSETSKEIIKLISELATDKLVLIVTHNYDEVRDIVTRKIRVHDGEVVEDEIYKELPNDENEVLDLDYVPVKNNIKFTIARMNLLSTPHKTTLSMIIFFLVALFSLFLYQLINDSYTGYVDNSFLYLGEEKIIVYDKLQNPLDMEKINKVSYDNITINSFYESYDGTVGFECLASNSNSMWFYGSYEKYPKDIKIDRGRMPQNENEVVLMMPLDYDSYYEMFYNSVMKINDKEITIVGLSHTEKVQSLVLTGNDLVERYIKMEMLRNRIDSVFAIDGACSLGFSYINITSDKTVIKLRYDNLPLPKLMYCDYELLDLNNVPFEKVVDEGECYDIVVCPGKDFFDKINENAYEISLYGNVKKMTSQIEDLGYEVINVAKYNQSDALSLFIDNLVRYLLIFISSVTLVVIFFITYVILSRVYNSKKKDFTVLRTLGVTKKDMVNVVVFDVMIQVIFTSIICYALVFILGKTVNNRIFDMFKNIDVITSVFYFVAMILFGYLMARRFNRRLFKLSVNSTFKGGVE